MRSISKIVPLRCGGMASNRSKQQQQQAFGTAATAVKDWLFENSKVPPSIIVINKFMKCIQ